MTKQHCPKCGYAWESRVEEPKSCPRCKTRLDFQRASSR
jgi:predicted Zn-ribbon and HTH transcriptional regulator